MIRRRAEFSKLTMRRAFARSNGICECHLIPHVFETACGQKLVDGRIRYEHIDPDAICGRNDLDNCATLTVQCWRFKTDRYDRPVIAKAVRVSDLARGIYDRNRKRLPGARDSDMRIKLQGRQVIDRRTGLPWWGSQ